MFRTRTSSTIFKELYDVRVHIFNGPIVDEPTKSLGIKIEYTPCKSFI